MVGRAVPGEPDDCVTFDCPFSWDGEKPMSLELEAGGTCEVHLNDTLVGTPATTMRVFGRVRI